MYDQSQHIRIKQKDLILIKEVRGQQDESQRGRIKINRMVIDDRQLHRLSYLLTKLFDNRSSGYENRINPIKEGLIICRGERRTRQINLWRSRIEM